MGYCIRAADPGDLDSLILLCREHAVYEGATYYIEGKKVLLGQALFGNSPRLYCYVIEFENANIGYFSYTFDFSTWAAQQFLYLDCLYLQPAHRGKKIGDIVFEKLKVIARDKGCVSIQWQTPISNHKAIRFYNRMGAEGKDKIRFLLNTNV
ncbi:MAG TPA: GNAT family N-acetyltransferase [Arachidicoccus sp.]|nr:GNAT family N-acetyltransferase [Arachidicoccus sp.]